MTPSNKNADPPAFAARSCFVLGISGGSCSGKTTLAREILKSLGKEHVAILFQDSYYIDQSARFREDGGDVNFDHPDSLDFALMSTHLRKLKEGKSIEVPIYDFVTHKRQKQSETFQSKELILVDGTLILSQQAVRAELNGSLFVEASEPLRFERRKRRDALERGRSLDGIVKQFERHVKPMHDTFVEPSAKQAGFAILGEGAVELGVQQALQYLRHEAQAYALASRF